MQREKDNFIPAVIKHVENLFLFFVDDSHFENFISISTNQHFTRESVKNSDKDFLLVEGFAEILLARRKFYQLVQFVNRYDVEYDISGIIFSLLERSFSPVYRIYPFVKPAIIGMAVIRDFSVGETAFSPFVSSLTIWREDYEHGTMIITMTTTGT